MNVRKVRRKCNVRGCKCTDSFAISKSREAGNTIIACKNCLKEALSAIESYEKEHPAKEKKALSAPPPLFFNSVIEKEEPEKTEENFICPKCGKTFKTEKGLNTHLLTHAEK